MKINKRKDRIEGRLNLIESKINQLKNSQTDFNEKWTPDPKNQLQRACEEFVLQCSHGNRTLSECLDDRKITEEMLRKNDYSLKRVATMYRVPSTMMKDYLLSNNK